MFRGSLSIPCPPKSVVRIQAPAVHAQSHRRSPIRIYFSPHNPPDMERIKNETAWQDGYPPITGQTAHFSRGFSGIHFPETEIPAGSRMKTACRITTGLVQDRFLFFSPGLMGRNGTTIKTARRQKHRRADQVSSSSQKSNVHERILPFPNRLSRPPGKHANPSVQ